MGHIEQRSKDSNGHEERVHDQRASQSKELANDEFPAAHRAREHSVKRALLDLLGNQTDPDEYGDDDAKQ